MFSYKLNGPDVSEEMKDNFRGLMKRGLSEFTKFRLRNPGYKHMELSKVYRIWWISRGPTGFKSPDDALHYKKDLWEFIQEFIEGITHESN